MDNNPYQVSASFGQVDDSDSVKAIRQDHLHHEVSLQSIGAVLFLCASLLGVSALARAVVQAKMGSLESIRELGILALHLSAVVVLVLLGRFISSLVPQAWIPALVVSTLLLLAFPLGTVFGAYFIYLLLSSKGRYIFSEAYFTVRAATPDMAYHTSWQAWAFLVVLLAMGVGTCLMVVR